MNWLLKTLAGAVIAGVGWKFGSDAYDMLKKRFAPSDEDKKKQAEDGSGACQTQVVDAPKTSHRGVSGSR